MARGGVVVGGLLFNVSARTDEFEKSMRKTQRELDKVSRRIGDLGKQLTMRFTAPIAAVGAVSLKMAGDFEKEMKRVQALSSSTTAEFARMEKQALELGATTRYSASQAAGGMGFLAMAGFEATQIISAMPSTLQLAAAANMELAQAADITTNVLTGYSMQVDDLDRANDAMVKGFTRSNTSMEQMGDAMKYVAPVASGLKIQFEETVAAIGLLGNAGIQGSMAGTSLRGALVRLQKPTGEVGAVIEKLGLDINDSNGRMRSMADIVEQLERSGASTADMMALFGQRAGPGMMALVEQGSKALRDFTKELEESGGTAKRIADSMTEGFSGAVLKLKSAFEGLMIQIAQSGLLDWATKFTERIAAIVSAMNEINPVILKHATMLGLVAAAIGPLLLAGAALVKMVSGSIGVYAALTKSIVLSIGSRKAEQVETAKATLALRAHTVALGMNTKAGAIARRANAARVAQLAASTAATSAMSKATLGLVTSIGKISLGPLLLIAAALYGVKVAADYIEKKAKDRYDKEMEVGNELAKQNHAIGEQVSNMSSALEKQWAMRDVQQRIAELEDEIAHATGNRKKELELSLSLMQRQQARIEKYGDEIVEINATERLAIAAATKLEKDRNKVLEERSKWLSANRDKIVEEYEELRLSMLPDEERIAELQKQIDKISWGHGAEGYLEEAMRMAAHISDPRAREEAELRAKQRYLEMQKILGHIAAAEARITDQKESQRVLSEQQRRDAEAEAQRLNDQIKTRENLIAEYQAMRLEAAGMDEQAKLLREEVELMAKVADLAESAGISEQQAENYLRNQLALQKEIIALREKDRGGAQYSDEARKKAQETLAAIEAGRLSTTKATRMEAEAILRGEAIAGDSVRFRKYADGASSTQQAPGQWMNDGAKSYVRDGAAAVGLRPGWLDTQAAPVADVPGMQGAKIATQPLPEVQRAEAQHSEVESSGLVAAVKELVAAIATGNTELTHTIARAFPA